MDKYFVSFSHSNGTGFTVIETNGSIESIEDIEYIGKYPLVEVKDVE